MKKRFLTVAFAVLMLVSLLFVIASCGGKKKDHEHSYTSAKTEATCTEDGKTVFTCECGDSYTEKIAALGHNTEKFTAKPATCTEAGYAAYEVCNRTGCTYNTKVEIPATGHCYLIDNFTLPTYKADGVKNATCESCGNTVTEKIDAISIAIPGIADTLIGIIEELSFTLEGDKDSSIVFTVESSDYSKADGYKKFVSIKLCDAKLYVEDGTPKGYVKIEVDTTNEITLDGTVAPEDVTPNRFVPFAKIEIFLDGDTISVDSTVDGDHVEENITVTDLIFDKILASSGVTEEVAMGLIYFASEIVKCLPELEEFANALENVQLPQISTSFMDTVADTFALFGEELIIATEQPDGSTLYEVDFTAISVLIDALDGKDIKTAIDTLYGAGTADKIRDFVMSIPELTVKDIAEFAITAAENYGFEVDQIFELVDEMIFAFTGESICVKHELENEYNTTVAELLNGKATDFDKDAFIAEFKENAGKFFDEFYAFDLNSILESMLPATEDGTSAIDQILDFVAQLNDMVVIRVIVDVEGALESITLDCGDVSLDITVDGDEANIYVVVPDGTIEATVGPDGFIFEVYDVDGESLAYAEISASDLGDGMTYIVGDLQANGIDLVDLEAYYMDGVLYSINFVAYDSVPYYDEFLDETVYVAGDEIISVQYSRDDTSDSDYVASLTVAVNGETILTVYSEVSDTYKSVMITLSESEDEPLACLSYEKTVSDSSTEESVYFYALSQGYTVFDLFAQVVDGELVSLYITVNEIEQEYLGEEEYEYYDEEYGEWVTYYEPIYGDYIIAGTTSILLNKDGDELVLTISKDDVEVTVYKETTEDGFTLSAWANNDDYLFEFMLVGAEIADGYEINFVLNEVSKEVYEDYYLTEDLHVALGFIIK